MCFSKFLNSFTMLSKSSRSTISKSSLFQMQIWHKFVSCQEKFVNDFIRIKLIFPNVIKMGCSLFLIKVDFYLLQIAQFDKCINLFCLVFLTLEFSFAVYFLQLT